MTPGCAYIYECLACSNLLQKGSIKAGIHLITYSLFVNHVFIPVNQNIVRIH
jgi:hypothetical protein